MKRVNILLSAYNGELYIKEQIDSILEQDYPNIRLYIRDDGSTDRTVSILEKYKDKIVLIKGQNKGFVRSFLELVCVCEEADYYAFADQDDIWKKNKISRAITLLEQKNTDLPLVYCSNFEIFNGSSAKKIKCKDLFLPFTIQKTIVNGQTGFGLTQVFNNPTRKIIIDHTIPQLSRAFWNETWVHMICLCFGEVIYDKQSTVYYRRHDNNVSIQEYRGGNWITHHLWQVRQFLLKAEGKKIYLDVKEFYDIFDKELDDKQKEKIELYIYKSGFKDRLKKVCYNARYRENIIDEIMLRFLFLIHRM